MDAVLGGFPAAASVTDASCALGDGPEVETRAMSFRWHWRYFYSGFAKRAWGKVMRISVY
ncbi:MAG: hypothetical protein WAK31_27370 [Chthoniobacterales bacterium]